MKIWQLEGVLNEMAPLAYAESYDNVGLLVGNPQEDIKGVLVCHDALESVIDEAIAKKCNAVVCFHPILFSGLKKITGKNYVEKAVLKAIKNDIAILAVHTALDNHQEGVNKILCNALGLENTKILIPKTNYIEKLIAFVPQKNLDDVKNGLFSVGAGNIGNYSNCSFTSNGTGTFKGNENSKPVVGQKNKLETVSEVKLEVTFEKHLQNMILKTLFENHPYEEVAYEIYSLENKLQNVGLGMIGEFKNAKNENDFLADVKKILQCGIIRHSSLLNKPIKRVAVLGGSGADAIKAAKAQKADAYITADLKYHNFFEAENELLLADVGHFESERFTKNYICDYLKEKITNFAIILSEENTNPVQYF